MKLVIDNRERALLDIIGECDKKNLDLGDIIIQNDDNKEVLVIERKTLADFANSIKDGRYREQKARLIECYALKGIKVMYIIEGFSERCDEKVGGIPCETLLSSMINTMFRDDIFVYRSKDIKGTCSFVLSVFKKYCNGDLLILGVSDPKISKSRTIVRDYIGESLKLKKKENKKDSDSMLFILCQVPRISVSIARVIREHYKSIKDLILAYEVNKNKRLMLADIKISEKRKLGKVASESIWKYLCE